MKTTVGKFIILLIIMSNFLNASVSISVSNNKIILSEKVTISINVIGDKIIMPTINTIDGNKVLHKYQTKKMIINNQKVVEETTFYYILQPDFDTIIPSFKIIVDDKVEMTKPMLIKVERPKASNFDEEYHIEFKIDKKEIYMGEKIKLTLIVKSPLSKRIDKMELIQPDINDFWQSGEVKKTYKREKTYELQIFNTFYTPKRPGIFNIDSFILKIGKFTGTKKTSSFLSKKQIKWKTVFSNKEKIKVKELPDGLNIYGDFKITAKTDTQNIIGNSPINLTLEIVGSGNLEDIEPFKLQIDNVDIYSDKPLIENGKFSQKFALISNNSYKIPSIDFSYFSSKKQKINKIYTNEIYINNQNKLKTKKKVLEFIEKSSKKENLTFNILFLILGFIIGVLVMKMKIKYNLKMNIRLKQKKYRKILRLKTDKQILDYLITLNFELKDKYIKEIIYEYEKSIYEKGIKKTKPKEIVSYLISNYKE